jgi:hypothetical protein
MQKIPDKYFWDGKNNLSEPFILKRILEYAHFPDLLKSSYGLLKDHIDEIDIDKLRTSPKRILFIKMILPHIKTSSGWEEAIDKALYYNKAVVHSADDNSEQECI